MSTNDLSPKQKRVYQCIQVGGPISNSEIGAFLNWPINRVTGRVFELREKGLIVDAGKRLCVVTGKRVSTWKLAEKKNETGLSASGEHDVRPGVHSDDQREVAGGSVQDHRP